MDGHYVVLKNNSFVKNMAYFEANDVFLEAPLHNVLIKDQTNSHSYGPNMANGGAIVVREKAGTVVAGTAGNKQIQFGRHNTDRIQISTQTLRIEQSVFNNTFAGIKASAVQLA